MCGHSVYVEFSAVDDLCTQRGVLNMPAHQILDYDLFIGRCNAWFCPSLGLFDLVLNFLRCGTVKRRSEFFTVSPTYTYSSSEEWFAQDDIGIDGNKFGDLLSERRFGTARNRRSFAVDPDSPSVLNISMSV